MPRQQGPAGATASNASDEAKTDKTGDVAGPEWVVYDGFTDAVTTAYGEAVKDGDAIKVPSDVGAQLVATGEFKPGTAPKGD